MKKQCISTDGCLQPAILLIALLLLFTSFLAFGQVKPHASIEGGYEDRHTAVLNHTTDWPVNSYWLRGKSFTDMKLFADYKNISVYTNVKTYFIINNLYTYDVRQIEYKIGINYKFKSLTFNAEHLCSHSLQIDNAFYEFYDRISLNITLF